MTLNMASATVRNTVRKGDETMTALHINKQLRGLLSLSDLRDCERIFEELNSNGSFATTICSNVAMYFRQNGFKVVRQGIGYIIQK